MKHTAHHGRNHRIYARHVLETMFLDEREFLCMMCNAFDRQQIMSEIHDPDFRMNKYKLQDPAADDKEGSAFKFTIYQMDHTKKGFVGLTTTKVLNLALEEIFLRIVLPSDGVGPIHVGKIEPRHRFPDLSHPSQLQEDEFLNFMGAGKK